MEKLPKPAHEADVSADDGCDGDVGNDGCGESDGDEEDDDEDDVDSDAVVDGHQLRETMLSTHCKACLWGMQLPCLLAGKPKLQYGRLAVTRQVCREGASCEILFRMLATLDAPDPWPTTPVVA